jgi:hypothetical protein
MPAKYQGIQEVDNHQAVTGEHDCMLLANQFPGSALGSKQWVAEAYTVISGVWAMPAGMAMGNR